MEIFNSIISLPAQVWASYCETVILIGFYDAAAPIQSFCAILVAYLLAIGMGYYLYDSNSQALRWWQNTIRWAAILFIAYACLPSFIVEQLSADLIATPLSPGFFFQGQSFANFFMFNRIHAVIFMGWSAILFGKFAKEVSLYRLHKKSMMKFIV